MMQVNYFGTVYVTKAACRMTPAGRAHVNISSVAGFWACLGAGL